MRRAATTRAVAAILVASISLSACGGSTPRAGASASAGATPTGGPSGPAVKIVGVHVGSLSPAAERRTQGRVEEVLNRYMRAFDAHNHVSGALVDFCNRSDTEQITCQVGLRSAPATLGRGVGVRMQFVVDLNPAGTIGEWTGTIYDRAGSAIHGLGG